MNNRYDRVQRVLGMESIQKLQKSKVLIIGFSGLGAEIVKNLVLTGVNYVTIIDNKKTSWYDLSSHFYLTEEDIGKSRLSCINKFKKLNENCNISYHSELTNELLENHDIVCFTDDQTFNLVKLNKLSRKYQTKFISCECRGLVGSVFCDFGNQFKILDPDGEEPIYHIISEIKSNNITIYTDNLNHGLSDEDQIIFEGDTNLEGKIFKIKVIGRYSFKIDFDLSDYHPKYVKQIKIPQIISHIDLENAIKNPSFLDYDLGKMNRSNELHKLFKLKYENNLTPEHSELAKKFLHGYSGNLNPIVTFIGGITAQEILKACTGKYTPLSQWFYFDAFECLPNNTNYSLIPDRYIGQRCVLGDDLQHKINNFNTFMVGVGALGCEYLKNFAMIGLHNVTITDPDTIEISNLSRQFLFRTEHIGELKSKCAYQTVSQMNDKMNIKYYSEKVCLETENIFTDNFWNNISGVVNALDNIHARLYVDTKCVTHQKPLIEAGTLGSKANIQVIYPHLTESYGDSNDPGEKEIPMCTLKNFPNMIEHCVQFMRDKFEELFNNNIQTAIESGEIEIIRNFEDCINWSRSLFDQLFVHPINKLLNNYPLDHINEDGSLFWSNGKICPIPLQYDSEKHINFIKYASYLKAENHFIPIPVNCNFDNCQIKIFEKEYTTKLKPIYFEKDDDTNYHIDFITEASNLRADNYKIPRTDRNKIKGIAGKIIPAMITTTALITGLGTLELYKIINKKNKLEDYRNSFVNLATPLCLQSEPVQTLTHNWTLGKWTKWDILRIDNQSLEKILKLFQEKYKVKVTAISSNSILLYSAFLPSNIPNIMTQSLDEIYYTITSEKVDKEMNLEFLCETLDTEEDVEIPTIKLKIEK